MNPGELAILLGVIPYGVLVGIALSNPLSGVLFYFTYSYLAIRHVREKRRGLVVFTVDSLLALLAALLLNLIVRF